MFIKKPFDLVSLFRRSYGNKRQEHFYVVTLSGMHEVIKSRVVTIGIANRTMVHPREVFWNAIKDNACAIAVAHNHPSGQLIPSPEDQEVTDRLCQAGRILGIPVLDHIIFNKKMEFYSFREHGELNEAFDGDFKSVVSDYKEVCCGL